ncbi:ParB N-terminal domain-containing protein [Antribacter gilvus]|uniref:ParB N-terminal domain-containing protein n=1 Tax=Antribacter gilvus TaxID=2304675 RepID=UPI000F77201D|nr:ParB N-terminal domain-containing protein [Antribacter gilvus]
MPEARERIGALSVAVDSIIVGVRHRKDVGDLDALAASIAKLGMLQPITITPARVLVCGWRRLEAVKRLGWDEVRVWVRSGLSDEAGRLLAEHDENALRQAYTRTEQATLYRELKEVLAGEARRRQEASRFRPEPNDGGADTGATEADASTIPGLVDSTGPEALASHGDTRDQAAMLATGRKSWQALERIGKLMDLAVEPGLPATVRDLAADAVNRIEGGGKVAPEWDAVQAALREHGVTTDPAAHSNLAPEPSEPVVARPVSLYALRTWAATWEGVSQLLDRHDPAILGPALPPDDWKAICDMRQRLDTMVEQMRAAREHSTTEKTAEPLAPVIAIGARS